MIGRQHQDDTAMTPSRVKPSMAIVACLDARQIRGVGPHRVNKRSGDGSASDARLNRWHMVRLFFFSGHPDALSVSFSCYQAPMPRVPRDC